MGWQYGAKESRRQSGDIAGAPIGSLGLSPQAEREAEGCGAEVGAEGACVHRPAALVFVRGQAHLAGKTQELG